MIVVGYYVFGVEVEVGDDVDVWIVLDECFVVFGYVVG